MGRVYVSSEDFAAAVKQVADAKGTTEDIAALTGLKVGSVSTRLSALRKRMREDGLDPTLVPTFRQGGSGGKRIDTAKIAAIFGG